MASKKRKLPLALRLIRFFFGLTDRLARPLAGRWAIKLFFQPFRFPYPPGEQEWLAKAERFELEYQGQPLAAYAWGSGPVVALMHGWAGRSTQFRFFLEALVAQGYRAVAVDAPAHGQSPGKRTDILEISEALGLLCEKTGPVKAIIGHSLGGAAAMKTMLDGLSIEKLVTIATPSIADDIVTEFMSRINGSAKTGRYITDYIENKYGITLESLTASVMAAQVQPLPALFVHDRDDREAPYSHVEAIHRGMPGGSVLATTQLGHTRILKDPEVIREVLAFLEAPVPSTAPEVHNSIAAP